jgi:dephospho-CoA kinase
MYKVGITGGIATGKSTVMNYLQEKGYPVIDCDILAKEALERDTNLVVELNKEMQKLIEKN